MITGDQSLGWWQELDVGTYEDKAAWLQAVEKLDPITP